MGLAQYVNQFLVWHKKFGLAQNVLGPVKGQGIKGQGIKGQGISKFSFCDSAKVFEEALKCN